LRALCLLREQVPYRRAAFIAGLLVCGYEVCDRIHDPRTGDVLVIWNRYGVFDNDANRFERAGATVLVAENGYLGNDFAGGIWYALSRGQHNGAGSWKEGGPERWDRLGIACAPWRYGGREVVVLPQRGIGPPGVAMPRDWLTKTRARLLASGIRHRVREHPGTRTDAVPLEQDLDEAAAVVTWGSGAALKALLLGIPVFYDMPNWIGSRAAAWIGDGPFRGDPLPMFRRLAWAMAPLEEIASGEAIRRLTGEVKCSPQSVAMF